MTMWELRSNRALPIAARNVERDSSGWLVRWSECDVMGVVNVTPDSFSDGGRFDTTERAVAHGLRLAAEGALIVDVGGESTRPGSAGVAVEVEIERAVPVIERLADQGAMLISIDTRKAEVARRAIEAGAHIVNDVGGFRDRAMIEVCAEAGVPVIAMHMRGTPADMQIDPCYDDVVAEVTGWLEEQAAAVLEAGVPSVMIDPGIGFGKTQAHNLELLHALPLTSAYPVLVGVSRKKTVQLLGQLSNDDDRDAGSIAVHLWAAQHGAAMVRVHDVAGHHVALAVDRGLRRGTT